MSTTPGTEIIELETGVYARIQEGLTNSGIIVGDDSVLIIDSLRVPSFARDLIEDVRHITNKPIKYVVDTHSHWDHAWGNEEFPEAVIIGHENARSEMLDVEAQSEWRAQVTSSGDSWSEEAKSVNITPPNLTFSNSLELHFGTRQIQLLHLGRAHTGGDIFIYLPNEKLLFTGDVAQNKGVPYIGDGYPLEWPDTDARLLEIDADHFMSGHGPIGDRSALQEARAFIADLVGNITLSIENGEDESSATENILHKLNDRFGDWRSFDRLHLALPGVISKLNKD